jgi:hypothetical protein
MVIKRKFKCIGCGKETPCFVEKYEEIGLTYPISKYDLRCIFEPEIYIADWEEIN